MAKLKQVFARTASWTLLGALSFTVPFADSVAQSPMQPAPGAGTTPVNPPGSYFFQLRHDTLEEREALLRREQADSRRKVPTEVAPLEAQKIDPSAARRR